MEKKLRLGLVGCGWFGNVHLDHVLSLPNVEMVALASTNQEKLQATAKKVPDARLYSSHEALLEGENNLDALFVCVPPHAHHGVELSAAKRGIHMYVEKPLAVHWEEAEANAQAIAQAGIVCAVGYQQRYAPGMEEVRALMPEGNFGQLHGRYFVSMPSASWWRKKATSGGQVAEQSTHLLDLMRWFAGEAESVLAVPQNGILPPDERTVDDASVAVIRFCSGATAVLASGCYAQPGMVPDCTDLTLFGRQLRADFDFEEGMRLWEKDHWRPFGPTTNNKARAVDAFLAAVRSGDTSLLRSTYEDAMKSFRLSIAVERALLEKCPLTQMKKV